jgi:glutamyl-tRNA reductase
MSEDTLRLLRHAGMKTSIMISNRTPERALALAERHGGVGVEWDRFPDALVNADIVIVSTSAPHIIVKLETVRRAMKARRGRRLFIIDISVPRNVDAEAGELADVFLYNIDDLQGVVSRNLGERAGEAGRVEQIIAEEAARFDHWRRGVAVGPAIAELRAHVDALRDQEWQRFAGRLAHLSEKDLRTVEMLTRQLAGKFVHMPVTRLKELGANGSGYERLEVVRDLFGLVAGLDKVADEAAAEPDPCGENDGAEDSADRRGGGR